MTSRVRNPCGSRRRAGTRQRAGCTLVRTGSGGGLDIAEVSLRCGSSRLNARDISLIARRRAASIRPASARDASSRCIVAIRTLTSLGMIGSGRFSRASASTVSTSARAYRELMRRVSAPSTSSGNPCAKTSRSRASSSAARSAVSGTTGTSYASASPIPRSSSSREGLAIQLASSVISALPKSSPHVT